MKNSTLGAAILAAFATAASAQPTLTGWQNNYSYALPGTPNYAAAQGSIVILYGNGMAPAGLLQQGFNPALNRNLGGVSVKFTVAGTTTEGIPYYTSPQAIGVILPSATPVGNGTVTVTYNGQTSAGLPIRVVQSAPGLLTMNGAGSGPAAVYDASYAYITPTNAANPGQTVTFWGTGLGPDPNDETRLITAPQASTAPFEFYIGNQLATVSYRGRSAYPGLDQMNVVIPSGVSGCSVSAYAKSGNWVSNFVTIPVATSGRVCSDPNGLQTSDILSLLSKPEVVFSSLTLSKSTSKTGDTTIGNVTIPGGTTVSDGASATFIRYRSSDLTAAASQGYPSIGGCQVSTYSGGNTPRIPNITFLDAGNITLTLPDGTTKPLTRSTFEGFLSYFLSGSDTTNDLFIPNGGGTFRFTGTGGPSVGAFSVSVPAVAGLNWTNKAAITNVNRSQSLEVTWTGGAANSYVIITGSSSSTQPLLVTNFYCVEAVTAGRFTIPAAVLSSLVASPANATGLTSGELSLSNVSDTVRFTAPGIDVGIVSVSTDDSISVRYQ